MFGVGADDAVFCYTREA